MQPRQLPDPLIVMAMEQEGGDVFRQAGVPVLFTGIGKVNAAHALTWKLAEYHHAGQPMPVVINFGTAGSRDFPVRSLVACRVFIQRDMDATPLGFAAGETPFDASPRRLEFPLLIPELPQAVCGTGDSFSTSHCDEECEVVDMEAYALAKVCWFHGAQFASVKYISDNADQEAHQAWRENVRHAAASFIQIYMKLAARKS